MLVRVINPKRVLRSASVGAEQVPPALSTLQAGTLIWLLTLESSYNNHPYNSRLILKNNIV
jgi:hypothetical protein